MRTRTHTPRHFLFAALLAAGVALGITGCATETTEASAETDDALSTQPVESLKSQVEGMLGSISASTQKAYIPKPNARAWLRGQVEKAGLTPEKATFVLRAQKFPLAYGVPFDHSELDLVEARQGNLEKPLHGRILGDIWGAGLYDDTLRGHDMGPPLCVTWDELDGAIQESYVPGAYMATFVCHDISFRALDKLGVSVHDYSTQVRGWKLASYAFGPIFAETPSAPATASLAARRCAALGIR